MEGEHITTKLQTCLNETGADDNFVFVARWFVEETRCFVEEAMETITRLESLLRERDRGRHSPFCSAEPTIPSLATKCTCGHDAVAAYWKEGGR